MEINLKNYEAFFLDYYEGKLNKEQSQKLFQFLEKHPELNEEFNCFENITLEDEGVFFNDKNLLIKPEVTYLNYEYYLIAEAEGDLSVNEKRALDNFLVQQPEYNKDQNIYSKIKATPDESVVFNLKEDLKKAGNKTVAKVIYLYRNIAVAASIVLAVFLFAQVSKNNGTEPVAEVKVENKKDVNPVNVTKKTQSIVEEKINLAEVKEKVHKQKEIRAQDNIIIREEIKNSQVAISAPEKIKPVVASEKFVLPQASVLEIDDKIQLPEEKTEVFEVSQPTLAQAAVNTVEKLISGSKQVGEANIGASIVELAANGLNKLTGEELVTFEKKFNEEGQLKKFQISAGNFGISRSKSK